MDKLDKIYEFQRQLQKSFGHDLCNLTGIEKVRAIKETILALTDELHEILNLFPWKDWKSYNGEHSSSLSDITEEVADALHFFINLCLILKISPRDLYSEYLRKNNKNIERIKNGTNNGVIDGFGC